MYSGKYYNIFKKSRIFAVLIRHKFDGKKVTFCDVIRINSDNS